MPVTTTVDIFKWWLVGLFRAGLLAFLIGLIQVQAWTAVSLAALVCGLLMAGSSHVYAGVFTGNPVLLLFNDWFGSPWFPADNFLDARWDAGFGMDLTDHTRRQEQSP